MKNTIFTITLLFLSFNGFSQKWIEVTKDKFGNKYYIKSSIVSKGGDFGNEESVIKIWTKETNEQLTDNRTKSKPKVYKNVYVIELTEFDCNSSKMRTLSRTAYSATGSVIVGNTINADFADWDYIIPDSVGETLLGKVCELYN